MSKSMNQNAANTVSNDLDTMIGQMLIVGFKGHSLSENNPIVNDIKNNGIGGVILFDKDYISREKRNIIDAKQVKFLTSKLQSVSKVRLFICIDQEGGKVSRLKQENGFPIFRSANDLGKINNKDITKNEADRTGRLLKELGINFDFAPVVDINSNKLNPVIARYDRSFSPDPAVVTEHALAFIQGLHQQNIISCIKHFPGHGSSIHDSHYGFVDVTDTWKPIELKPFTKIIESHTCDSIMIGHLYNKNLDNLYPASLSQKTVTGILRKRLMFNGVIISDDLQMKAITDKYMLKQSICLSINAGVDILLFCNNISYDPNITEKVKHVIHELIDENKISLSRIKESYMRITSLKEKMKI